MVPMEIGGVTQQMAYQNIMSARLDGLRACQK